MSSLLVQSDKEKMKWDAGTGLDSQELAPTPTKVEQGETIETTLHDDVFGEITEGGPNYRNVGWLGTAALMMKTQIGLGVLSIPSSLDTLGLIPGIIVLVVTAIVTTWSDYMVGAFKLRHPHIYGIDDVGQMLFGRIGREVLGTAFCLYLIFTSGSAMLGVSIGLNAVSLHGACTAIFVAVAAILGFSFASIRTLGRISFLAWIGLICILTGIAIVTVAVGVQERPASAPKEGVFVSDYKLVNNASFAETVSAISAIIFAYAGTPSFFSFAAEMRDPRLFTRSLIVCQTTVTIVYIIVGCVVYYFCGSYVASPALGSAGPLIKRISYGLALPGLTVTAFLNLHICAKQIFLRLLRGSKHLTSNSLTHWAIWISCTFASTVVSYCIASGIPVFGGLVSLVGALLGTFMSMQPMGCMWLYDNWSTGKQAPTKKWYLMVAWSVFVIVAGTFFMIAGTYGSIVGIVESLKSAEVSKPWSCADNSNSV